MYAGDNKTYDIFGVTTEELYNIYKLTPVVHQGFCLMGKEEQAEVKDETNAEKSICAFCQPKLNVGNEWVSKGKTKLVPYHGCQVCLWYWRYWP